MRNLIFSIGFIAVLTTTAWADAPACFRTRSFGRDTCRQEAAVAAVGGDGHFLVWGGKESRGCDQCTRMVVGNATGGLYDESGRLIETLATENSPGPRFGAQALWNGAAFFVWGGKVRQNERWVQDHHEVVTSVAASLGSFYVPGARKWTRMSAEGAPASDGQLSFTGSSLVQVCDAVGCKVFDMASNSWE